MDDPRATAALARSRSEERRAASVAWSAREAERYLLGLERFGMHFGLEKMGRLMALLDSPQDRFASVHVVGTNGKSSTTRMIAAILERHGVRTGSYTSPHLVSFTERIQVGERDLSDERFGPAVERVAGAAAIVDRTTAEDGDPVTQFEALTGAAYAELARAGVEVAAIEAGLGGRYDATSVIASKVAVLTNIGLEHTAWLGDTIAAIAAEKLAVVPAGGVLVLGAGLHPDALAVARAVAGERGARIAEAAGTLAPEIRLRARGSYQRRNFALAMAAAEAYLGQAARPRGGATGSVRAPRPADASRCSRGRRRQPAAVVRRPTGRHGSAGRTRERSPCSTGHTTRPGSTRSSSRSRSSWPAAGCARWSRCSRTRTPGACSAALLPVCDRMICTAASNPRALAPTSLGRRPSRSRRRSVSVPVPVPVPCLSRNKTGAGATAVEVEVEPDPERAVAFGRLREPGGVVLVTGSIYLISDIVRGPRPGSTL